MNELRALLRKGCEGWFGHLRDWDALAQLIIWLECHGLAGVNKYLAASKNVPSRPPRLVFKDQTNLEVYSGGHSLLFDCDAVCDLAIADAKRHGKSRVKVFDADDGEIIFAALARCARSGLASAAMWHGKNDKAVAAKQWGAAPSPQIGFAAPLKHLRPKSVIFVAAQSADVIEAIHAKWFASEGGDAPHAFKDSSEHHIDNGFALRQTDYSRLCELAAAVLVEASDESRQGAGPS